MRSAACAHDVRRPPVAPLERQRAVPRWRRCFSSMAATARCNSASAGLLAPPRRGSDEVSRARPEQHDVQRFPAFPPPQLDRRWRAPRTRPARYPARSLASSATKRIRFAAPAGLRSLHRTLGVLMPFIALHRRGVAQSHAMIDSARDARRYSRYATAQCFGPTTSISAYPALASCSRYEPRFGRLTHAGLTMLEDMSLSSCPELSRRTVVGSSP